jgi:hypothetical protein
MAKYVYVAGSYRNNPDGHLEAVLQMIRVAEQLIAKGYTPFVPLLNHWWECHFPEGKNHDYWMKWDLAWLDRCDILFRMQNGPSEGADEEELKAYREGKKVYYNVEEMPDA